MAAPLLEIRNLCVSFATRSGAFKAVDGVDLTVNPNEVLAIVGESGSGKSVAMLAVMGLLPFTATVSTSRGRSQGLHDDSATLSRSRLVGSLNWRNAILSSQSPLVHESALIKT